MGISGPKPVGEVSKPFYKSNKRIKSLTVIVGGSTSVTLRSFVGIKKQKGAQLDPVVAETDPSNVVGGVIREETEVGTDMGWVEVTTRGFLIKVTSLVLLIKIYT